MGYAFVTPVASREDLAAVDGVLLVRGLMSPAAAHMASTGLTAAALWGSAADRWHHRGLLTLAATFGVAVAPLATWHSIGTTPAYIVLGAFSLVLLFVYAWWIARHDRVLRPKGPVARGGQPLGDAALRAPDSQASP